MIKKQAPPDAGEIKEFARSIGADLVGIASVERFENAPRGYHPRDLLPNAEAVIVIGKAIPLGVLRGNSKGAITRTYETLFHLLDGCAYEISSFIEKRGGQAMPVPADTPYMYWNADEQEGRADLSHRHAAVLAGFGSLGKSAMLLTPEFGNRINLASVLTNVPLEGDPLVRNDLCIPDCDRCIKTCPANAIRGDGTVIQKECRGFHSITTPRGFKLFACWECRKVCPAQGTSMREPADLK